MYAMYDLNELATNLCAIEDWLRNDSTARHSDYMADEVRKAWNIVEDMIDAEIFCVVCRRSLSQHTGMQVWLCHSIVRDRVRT